MALYTPQVLQSTDFCLFKMLLHCCTLSVNGASGYVGGREEGGDEGLGMGANAHTHIYAQTLTHIYMYTLTQTHTHTYSHKHIHVLPHTQIHTLTCTHTLLRIYAKLTLPPLHTPPPPPPPHTYRQFCWMRNCNMATQSSLRHVRHLTLGAL